MKNFSGYRALTSRFYRLILLLLALGSMAISFLANVYIGDAGVFIITALVSSVQIFLDYFVFGGISSRQQRGMEMMKSSCFGIDLLDSALRTDMYIKAFINLSGFLGFIAAEIIYSEEVGISIVAIMLVLVMYPLTNFLTRLVLILSRRIAVTMVSQIFVTYLASSFAGFICILLSLVLPEDSGNVVIFAVITAIVFEILSILTAYLLIKDCKK